MLCVPTLTSHSVELDCSHEVIGYLSGKIHRYYIRILLGDRIRMELSPYDLDRGCIVYRYKRRVGSEAYYTAGYTSTESLEGTKGIKLILTAIETTETLPGDTRGGLLFRLVVRERRADSDGQSSFRPHTAACVTRNTVSRSPLPH